MKKVILVSTNAITNIGTCGGVKNTEIPLRLKSNSQLGYDGIPLKGEEIIGRYEQKKTVTTHVLILYSGVKSYWRLGQSTPHTANIGQMIGSQNISRIFDAIIKR